MTYIEEYVKEIESGNVVTSKKVHKVYKKLAERIREPQGQYIYDDERANRPIEFTEQFCKHSKGEWAGKPIKLELFQKAFISALFGFIDKDTGLRQYQEAFFMVGRKNGKSTLLSAIALYMLMADGEPGAEVYSVATKKDQAKIVFDEALNMARQSKYLSKALRKRKTDLYFEYTLSKMQPLGKNSDTLDGLNANAVIIDELHGVKDRNLYEVMKQSQSTRRQPLLIMITTAGTVRGTIFDDMYAYANNIVSGSFKDDTFLPIIYELDKEEEWKNPKAWQKANPSLGAIKKYSDLETKVERAKQNPADLNGVLCKDFNIRQTVTTSWLEFNDINNTSTYKLEDFKGSYFIGGADLSKTLDLTSATILLKKPGEDEYCINHMYWIPKETFFKRVEEEKIPYDIWYEQGHIRLCEGNTIDYADVTTWFMEMVEQYDLTPLWIYYDSWSATYWVNEMQANGFNMVDCKQTVKTLSLPMQQLGADLQAKKVNYNNNPITKWCLTNTGIMTDANGNIFPVKNQSAKQRIDGMASLLNCYVGLLEHQNEFHELADDL